MPHAARSVSSASSSSLASFETYLSLNATALADYGRRYRAGLRIASSGAESVVNSLVNARMNKRRQMRWSPQAAHRVLQVRAAVMDGRPVRRSDAYRCLTAPNSVPLPDRRERLANFGAKRTVLAANLK